LPECETSTLTPVCGDNRVVATETCDDGNVNSGDGCSSSCSVECGYTCSPVDDKNFDAGYGPCITYAFDYSQNKGKCEEHGACLLRTIISIGSFPITTSAYCAVSCKDECSNSISVPGWSRFFLTTVCVSTCGDGVKTQSEGCDDGNTVSGDGCSRSCSTEDSILSSVYSPLIQGNSDEFIVSTQKWLQWTSVLPVCGQSTFALKVEQYIQITVQYDYGHVFFVNGIKHPILEMERNKQYTFDQSHWSNSGHLVHFTLENHQPFTTPATALISTTGAQTVVEVSPAYPYFVSAEWTNTIRYSGACGGRLVAPGGPFLSHWGAEEEV
jgi:cysteine-rich repeat protein